VFGVCAFLSWRYSAYPQIEIGERFIGHGDRAANANLARNIVEGNGPIVDHVWFLGNGGTPRNDIPRPEGCWSVYFGYLTASFFALFGPTQKSIMTMGWFFRMLIALLGAGWVLVIDRSPWATLGCGLTLLIGQQMVTLSPGLFDLYFAFFFFLTVTLVVLALHRNSGVIAFFSGISGGIAFGLKILGAIVPIAFFCLAFLFPDQRRNIGLWLVMAGGFIVALTPMAAFNWLYHDTLSVLPSASLLVQKSILVTRATGDHNFATYYPGSYEIPSFSFYLWKRGFIFRLSRLLIFLKSFVLTPLAFVGLWSFLVRAYKKRSFPKDVEGLFTFLCWISILGGVTTLVFIKFEPRYFSFFLPMLTVLGFASVKCYSRLLHGLTIVVILVTLLETRSAHRWLMPKPVPIEYQKVREILPKKGVVLNSNPWQFSFHTLRRAVALPYTDDSDMILSVARRYGADYIVSVNGDSRHSYYNDFDEGRFPPYLEKVYFSKTLAIGRIKPEALAGSVK